MDLYIFFDIFVLLIITLILVIVFFILYKIKGKIKYIKGVVYCVALTSLLISLIPVRNIYWFIDRLRNDIIHRGEHIDYDILLISISENLDFIYLLIGIMIITYVLLFISLRYAFKQITT